MKFRQSLRLRITFTFFLFGTLLMSAVATAVYYAVEDIESRVIEKNLKAELNHFIEHYRSDPNYPLPNSINIEAYLVSAENGHDLPAYLSELSPGIHEVKHNGNYSQVIIGKIEDKKIVLDMEVTQFEEREGRILNALIAAVIAASILSLWLGYALSQRAIAPVTDLANTVVTLDPNKPVIKLSNRYVNDEVGELAHAFEQYLYRLEEFVAREQEFTANASHELRTPLAIIKGAVEVLNTTTELTPHASRVLQRIERAVISMSQIVETLLLLAREDDVTEEEFIHLSSVMQAVIDESSALLNDKPVELELLVEKDISLQVSSSIVSILMGNLLRNAIAYTSEGKVSVSICSPQVVVTDTGAGITDQELPKIFERYFRAGEKRVEGSGIGLAIVKRICDRYDWHISIDSISGQGTRVAIDFSASISST